MSDEQAANAPSASGAEGSAPPVNQQDTGGKVDSPPKQQPQNGGMLGELVHKRQQVRETKEKLSAEAARNDELSQKVASLESTIAEFKSSMESMGLPAQAPQTSQGVGQADLDAKIQASIAAYAEQSRLTQDVQEAEQYLLSRDHFKSDQSGIQEVVNAIKTDPRLSAVMQVDPGLAVREAERLWASAKGISLPDQNGKTHTPGAKAAGGVPSSPASSGGKTWSSKDAGDYINAAGKDRAEMAKRIEEVKQAQREGRVKQ